jgi:hypothetical protein
MGPLDMMEPGKFSSFDIKFICPPRSLEIIRQEMFCRATLIPADNPAGPAPTIITS